MGKLLLILFMVSFAAIATVGAYFMGTQSVVSHAEVHTTPMPTFSFQAPQESGATDSGQLASSSGEMIIAKKTVSGGALLYQLYSIDVLPGWSVKKGQSDTVTDTMTFSRGGYELSINQSNTGGGLCSFQDVPADEGPLTTAYTNTEYVDITGVEGQQYRRVPISEEIGEDKVRYKICDKRRDIYQFPSRYGHITYIFPKDTDESLIKDMDTMVSTLRNRH